MKNQSDRVFIAIFCCISAHFMFAIMGTCAKYLTQELGYHVAEAAFYRNLIVLLPLLAYILIRRNTDILKTQKPKLVGFRALLGGISLMVTFAALEKLPMAYATVLFFMSSLLTPALAFFVLKEHVGIHRWSAVIVGMCGVIIIAQPSGAISIAGLILALLAATMHGIMYTTLRGLKTENPFTVTFYFIVAGVLIPAAFLPWVAKGVAQDHIWIFLLIGASGGIAQIFLVNAYKYAPASTVTPFSYSALLWTILIDINLWGYQLDFWILTSGAALIMSAQLYILYREYLQEHKKKKAPIKA